MKITYNSPVVLSFALLATVIYFVNTFTANIFANLFVCPASMNFANPIDYIRLFTHPLGHANLQHLVGNMTYILLLGPILEEKYGSRNILIMILTTAFITGILNVLFLPTGLLGASGIVFMFIILVSFTNPQDGIPLTFVLILVLFLGQELLNAFSNDNISQFAHIIGGLVGSFYGFMLNRREKIIN